MSLVESAPHEVEGNLIYAENELSPYWMVGKLLHQEFDGYSGDIEIDLDGEQWNVELAYQKGGIAPREEDDLDVDRLYEYRINAQGNGQRKVSFHIQPRFPEMRHYETGEEIPSPFNGDTGADEGVNVKFHGSNVEPDLYPGLLWEFVQALASEAETGINHSYFRTLHEWSNIYAYERYVRVRRSMAKKYIRNDGVMRRLWELVADKEGSQAEYKVDNRDIVGYNHRLVLPQQDAARLAPDHELGKQLKHYHPKYVRDGQNGDGDEDPLYHPKIGALAKQSLNSESFAWSDRKQVREELEETLLNTLDWSKIPVSPGGTTFVADDHFDATATDANVQLYKDPTPKIEAEQEALIVTALREMTDADVDIVETLVSDGEDQHYQKVADGSGHSVSTLYRALQRMRGIIESNGGEVRFGSRKIAQEIQAIVESTEHHLRNAADRAAQLVTMDKERAESSAFQRWLNEYAVEVMETRDDGRLRLRIETVLSSLKSSSLPHIQEALAAGYSAWVRDGRDAVDFLKSRVKWSDGGETKTSLPSKHLR